MDLRTGSRNSLRACRGCSGTTDHEGDRDASHGRQEPFDEGDGVPHGTKPWMHDDVPGSGGADPEEYTQNE
ncbi:hypothetical protein GCM10027596_31380 [Nocardioides korecus]